MMKNKILYILSVAVIFFAARTFAFADSRRDSTLRFAFLTDTHLAANSGAIDDLKACLRDINDQDSLDFVLFGGDITDFGTDEEIALAK